MTKSDAVVYVLCFYRFFRRCFIDFLCCSSGYFFFCTAAAAAADL